MRISLLVCVVLFVSSLMACSAVPKSNYYTLQTPTAYPAASTVVHNPGFAISVQFVDVPSQVDRPQLVLSDDTSTEVTLLNDSQWAAPLSDEIRYALVNDLTTRLNVLDVPLSAAGQLPVWIIEMDVQRFESIYGQWAGSSVTWRLTPRHLKNETALICRAAIRVPVESSVEALVDGHRQGLARIGKIIAAQLLHENVAADEYVSFSDCAELSAPA